MDDINTPQQTETQAHVEQELPSSTANQPVPLANANTAVSGPDVIREDDKIMLILAYLFPFVPFFTVKDSEYVLFHARQGLILWIVGCVASSFTCGLASLFWLVAIIIGIKEALVPKRWRCPGIATLSEKIFK